MAVDATPRAVSGEIMTGAAVPPTALRRPDVIDAQVIHADATDRSTISAIPELPRSSFGSPRPASSFGFQVLEGAQADKGSPRAGALFWSAGLALAFSAFWISGGHALALSAAPVVAPGKLAITQVETETKTVNGRTTLAVDGEAHNGTVTVQHMPPIGIAVTGSDGTVTRYTLSTNADQIAAGEIYLFSSRLRVPPSGVKSVSVELQPAD